MLSHHGGDASKIERISRINRLFMGHFAYLLDRLAATPDGAGSLLDSTMVLIGAAFGEPNDHDNLDLPIIVAGGGVPRQPPCGVPKLTPMANLMLSMMQRLGHRAAAVRRQHRATGGVDGLMRKPLLHMVFATLPAIAGASGAVPLVEAIRGGDYASVARLADRTTANAALPDGSTPLSWAVETQDARMVRLLLKSGAKPDAAGNVAAAPLLLACEHGDAAVLALLLDARPDVRRARPDGIAPLALCAAPRFHCHPHAPAGCRRRSGSRGLRRPDALMHAAAAGRVDNLQLLLARGAAVNRATPQWLHAAVLRTEERQPRRFDGRTPMPVAMPPMSAPKAPPPCSWPCTRATSPSPRR